MWRLFIGALPAVVLLMAGASSRAGVVYWADLLDAGRILRGDPFAGDVAEIVTGAGQVSDLAVHVSAGKLYWVNRGLDYTIWRANLDGSQVEGLLNRPAALGLALDVPRGKLYWTDRGLEHVFRANLDGTGVEDVFPAAEASFLEVDSVAAKIYWTDFEAIRRANLDGSNEEALFQSTTTLAAPVDFALDAANNALFFTGSAPNKIRRFDLAGGGLTTLVTGTGDPLEPHAGHIAVDAANRIVYWTERGNLDETPAYPPGVFRYHVDTGSIDAAIFDGLPGTIVYVPEPSTVTLAMLGSLLVCGIGARRRVVNPWPQRMVRGDGHPGRLW
jgi:hypothetical protein